MITPSFKLTQNDEFLFINIKAPYAKLNELDIFVDETDFRFYCKPYYLRLNLPGSIIENEDCLNYDFDERVFKLKYEKKNKGQHFDGLDLLTKLLTPKNEKSSNQINLIEEIQDDNGEHDDDDSQNQEEEDDEDNIEWYIEQNLNEDENNELKIKNSDNKYGFAQTKSNVFSKLSSEYGLVIDLPDPDGVDSTQENRKNLRTLDESIKFDDDHYLADFFDDTELIEGVILKYKPEFGKSSQDIEFTDSEIDILKNLPKKTYLLDKEQKFFAYSGLVDILFAYCYNNRINCGEKNVESGWTISKLSSTLSWLDTFKSLEEVVRTSFRRSLCYPLYRNWKLTNKVYKDLIKLLKSGRNQIIKSLIEIRSSFIDGDNRYILNDLYINDYIIWIQYASEKKLKALIECLEKIKITKEMLDLDLECLEAAGESALNDNNNNQADNSVESDNEKDLEKNSSILQESCLATIKNVNNNNKEDESNNDSKIDQKPIVGSGSLLEPTNPEISDYLNVLDISENSSTETKNKNKPKIIELN